jgi:uncharacterized protein YdaT
MINTNIRNDYIQKLPENFLDLIATERDKKYKVNINSNLPLENQELLEDTINILAMLNLEYWYNNDEKNMLKQLLASNEQDYQNFINEKYNPDNLFKKRTHHTEQVLENAMIEYKESFIIKIINRIKNIFKA